MAKAKNPDRKPIPSVRDLPCVLTDEERKTRTNELLDCEDRLEALDEEKKKAVADIKARAAEVQARVKVLRGVLRAGDESRQVGCTTAYDFETMKMVTTRDDTGAVIESRPMNDNERQGRLFNEPADTRPDAEVVRPTFKPEVIAGGKGPVEEAVARAEGQLADAPAGFDGGKPAEGGFPGMDGATTREELLAAKEPVVGKRSSRRKRADSIMDKKGDGPAHAPGHE